MDGDEKTQEGQEFDYEAAYQQTVADVISIEHLLTENRPLEALRRAKEVKQRYHNR